MLRIVDIFKKSTFVDLPTTITDIGDFEAIGTHLFNKVRTVLRTIRTQLTVLCRWTMAFIPAAYVLCSAGLTMFTRIKRITGTSRGDL